MLDASDGLTRRISTGTYQPLLGTTVEIHVVAAADDPEVAASAATAADQVAVGEIQRLQRVFSVFDADSELSRWRRGAHDELSADLSTVLTAAYEWWARSTGAFHPTAAGLRQLWLQAEREDRPPSPDRLAAAVAKLRDLPFRADGGAVLRTGDCRDVDLNAVAKGYIVDCAVAMAAEAAGVVDVLVNAGGDLRHEGERTIRVGVEDPGAVGGPPLAVVQLRNGALATSGAVHRGFRVAGMWYGHVIDPRTGHPVAGRPSTTVRAQDAMTADLLATVAGVLPWAQAAPFLDAHGGAALAVLGDGELVRSAGWRDARNPRQGPARAGESARG